MCQTIKQTELEFYNPVEKAKSILKINQMPFNRLRLNTCRHWKDDDDIIEILQSLYNDLNLTNLIDGMIKMKIDSPRYNSLLSEYLFYVEHLENRLLWNIWIDKLLFIHAINLAFEKDYIPINKVETKKPTKNTYKNQFYRRGVPTLFDEEIIYEYINPKTGEIIKSTNPNLLDKLNSSIKNKPSERKHRSKNNNKEKKEKINKKPDFNKLKFKF